MGHENGGWMNDDQREAMKDAALRKEAFDSIEPAHERRAGHSTLFVKEEVVNTFKTILAWCDRSGEEPEGQCLHEIEQVCRNALGLDLLRPVNVVPRVCCIVQTRDRMPEPHVLVIVSGGVAVWTGSVWLSKTGDDSGQVIRWEVTWWMSLPVDERTDRREAALKQSYADLASSGGIVDAP